MNEELNISHPAKLFAAQDSDEFVHSAEEIIEAFGLDPCQTRKIIEYGVVQEKWYAKVPVELSSKGFICGCEIMSFSSFEEVALTCDRALAALVKQRNPNYPKAIAHVVNYADSLSKIALKYYGNARLWVKIWRANRAILETPDVIKIGQVLIIP